MPPMRRYFPDFEQFRYAAQDAEVIPVYRQLLADRLTPVTAFEVLGRESHAFLLESVVGGEKIARYSFIAAGPSLVYQAAGGKAVIDEPVSHRTRTGKSGAFDTADPLADRLTPVSAFEVLGREPHAFLLESVVGGEKIARYSFIAAGASLVYQVSGGKAVSGRTRRRPSGPRRRIRERRGGGACPSRATPRHRLGGRACR